MPDETKHGIDCTEFEALLSDAMDGTELSESAQAELRRASAMLRGLRSAVRGRRRRDASGCGRSKRSSLRRYLVHNILVGDQRRGEHARGADRRATGGHSVGRAGARVVGFVVCAGLGVCAAAAVCHVVRDDLLLVLAGAERGRGEAVGCGEGSICGRRRCGMRTMTRRSRWCSITTISGSCMRSNRRCAS